MIYVLCITQLTTVIAALIAVRWGLKYFEQQSEKTRVLITDVTTLSADNVKSSQEAVRSAVESSSAYVQRVIDQSYRDREVLCERIQFPETMRAQAPSVGAPTNTPHVMDEQKEFEFDNPDAQQEPPPVSDIIPGARRDNDEIIPVPTVKPFGRARSHATT